MTLHAPFPDNFLQRFLLYTEDIKKHASQPRIIWHTQRSCQTPAITFSVPGKEPFLQPGLLTSWSFLTPGVYFLLYVKLKLILILVSVWQSLVLLFFPRIKEFDLPQVLPCLLLMFVAVVIVVVIYIYLFMLHTLCIPLGMEST